MTGAALIRSEKDSSLRLGADLIRLDRDRKTGEPLKLNLIGNADLVNGVELQVQARRIEWDAKKSLLAIRGDREQGRMAKFRIRAEEDEAWFVLLDLEDMILQRIDRKR